MTTVHMAVDVHDQLIRACATPEAAEEWLTRRAHTAHGTQNEVVFKDDPMIPGQRYALIGDESWLLGAYRIISQEVLGDVAPAEPTPEAKEA